MVKIFGDANEKYLMGVKFYADENHVLFMDEDCEKEVDPEEVANAFVKGLMLIVDGDEVFKPVSADLADGEYNCVTYASSTVGVVTYTCEAAE